MIFYVDTSALLKRYLDESGSEKMKSLFESATTIIVSSISQIECTSALQRLLRTKYINSEKYELLKKEIALDHSFFEIIEFDSHLIDLSIKLMEKYPLKPLDTIQLASGLQVIKQIDSFVLADDQLKKYALKEGLHIINPLI